MPLHSIYTIMFLWCVQVMSQRSYLRGEHHHNVVKYKWGALDFLYAPIFTSWEHVSEKHGGLPQ